MTRSTKLSFKFTNKCHVAQLHAFTTEYRKVAVLVCAKLWLEPTLPKFINPKLLGISTWLSARALQACCKQVVALIKGTRKSRKALHSVETGVPDASHIQPCLDSRFIKLDLNSGTSFDIWLNLASLGYKTKLRFPLKRTRHFNKLMVNGKLLGSVTLSSKTVTFSFELPAPAPAIGATVGIDVGISNVATSSHQATYSQHPHGWTYSQILQRLARRQPWSHNFRQTQAHRDNFVNWWVNQLDLSGVGTVKLENIHDLRRHKRTDRFRSHWNYPYIFRKLESRCTGLGVQVQYVNPAFTSQECSACGAVDRRNRVGASFKCVACGHTDGADPNASVVISRRPSLDLAGRGAYIPRATGMNCYAGHDYRSEFEKLRLGGRLDPHFCDKHKGPLARFEPTDLGWLMAKNFVEAIIAN